MVTLKEYFKKEDFGLFQMRNRFLDKCQNTVCCYPETYKANDQIS
jgi:hypothetical protein